MNAELFSKKHSRNYANTRILKLMIRKQLRANPIAPWEVKVGKYRVFYAIEADEHVVVIVSIGHKEHNTLYIRGKVVQL